MGKTQFTTLVSPDSYSKTFAFMLPNAGYPKGVLQTKKRSPVEEK